MADLVELILTRHLPGDTRDRVRRSLARLEAFPQAGRSLSGRWSRFRLLIGPWPWLLLIYRYDDSTDTVTVLAVHDARSATSATTAT